MLAGQEKLQSIAFVVSMLVIIGIAITFSILFILYGKYKIANIKNGHEDPLVEKDIRRKYRKIIEGQLKHEVVEEEAFKYRLFQKTETVETHVLERDPANDSLKIDTKPVTIYDSIVGSREKNKKYQVLLNIIFGIFYFILGVLIIISVSYKLMGETVYFGNTTLLTIKTGSMETVNDSNTYIDENNLTNQIEQYSIITLNKVKSDDELNLYDIAAYEHDNTIYVHRIIRKYTNSTTGVTYYTFRGDANSESLSFELTITLDDIVGKYTGFQNYGLGVTLTYLQSTIGIVAMAAALIFLITYNVTEDRIETNYYKRILLISQELDKKLGFITSEVK